jgi:alpha-L-fucosidase
MVVKQASVHGVESFQDARFGLFVVWGLYALLGIEEWVMHTHRIPIPEYERLMDRFNPTKFDADAIVSMAADAGQRYIVYTSRHHDGFSMYNTAHSDYKVTNTPVQRDPQLELAEACARNGQVKLGIYNSLLDWHHPAYRFRQESGLAWSDYLEFLHGQVREICTNYGEIACLWFDGDWPGSPILDEFPHFCPGGSFEYETLYSMIHTLQPDAVILNNHHVDPLPGEDIQGYEQDLPGMNTAGWNKAQISRLPLEVCMTINDHWGYSAADRNHKSTRNLIHMLVRSASVGANYLLDVGPTGEGEIEPVHVARLRAMGEWLRINGESVYGTRRGSIPPTSVSVSTRRDDTHYVHLLEYPSDAVTLHGVPDTVQRAYLLRDGQPVAMKRHDDGATLLIVPEAQRDSIDTVVVLTS